jgi:competence protein ComEC
MTYILIILNLIKLGSHLLSNIALYILDVGHGNSAVLVDNKGVVVFDAGPGTSLLEFLIQEEIANIDVLLISHADKDHIKGVISLLESQINIGIVQLNTNSEKGTDTWDDMTYELDQANKKEKLHFNIGLITNDTGKFDKGEIHIEILAPTPYLAAKGPGSVDRAGRTLTSNSVSAVIRLSKKGSPFVLLASDIDDIGFLNLLEDNTDPSAPIVVFPHHGGKTGKDTDTETFTRKFCKVAKPEVVVFSNGRGEHATPREEITQTIREELPKTRIMCTQLSENCASELRLKEFSHLATKFAKGREKGKCCAGTIVFNLSKDKISIQPDENKHKTFIKKAAPTALCLRD